MGYVGENELVAVTFVTTINQIVLSVGSGLSIAATSLIALNIGIKNYDKAKVYLTQTIIVSILVSLIIMFVGFLYSNEIIIAAGATDPTIKEDSLLYWKLNLIATPILLLEMAYVAVKRATGESRIIMWLLFISMVAKVLITGVLVLVFNLGIYGLFIGTIFSKCIFVIMSLIDYFVITSPLKLKLNDFKLKITYVIQLMIVGLPIALEKSTLQFGHIMVNKNVMSFGTSFFAAYGIANKINMLGLGFLMGISDGIVPIFAQNLAANKLDRFKKAVLYGSMLTVMIALPLFLLFSLIPEVFVNLFVIDNPHTINETVHGLRIISIGLIPWGLYFIASGILKAYANPMNNFIMGFISFVRLYAFRLGLLYYLVYYLKYGKDGIWYAVGLSNVFGAVFIWIITFFAVDLFRRKRKKRRSKSALINSMVPITETN